MGAVSFWDILKDWHRDHTRDLPWTKTSHPYHIWVSEVILQQTQVARGKEYFNTFLNTFPDVESLAKASEEKVLKAWQGLGYNSRARYLHQAARQIVFDRGGRFPETYDEWLALKGVGPYTAAAISSFAFGEPTPALDANVIRIVCRYYAITEDPSRSATRKLLMDILRSLMPADEPGAFNQAMMDFGALQCTPRSPNCAVCPFAVTCGAYHEGLVTSLPVKASRKPRRKRFFHYFLITDERGLILRKRQEKDIWHGMFDLPGIELQGSRPLMDRTVISRAASMVSLSKPEVQTVSTDNQTLTHQIISATFYHVGCSMVENPPPDSNHVYVPYEKLSAFALPAIIDCYFRSKSILL